MVDWLRSYEKRRKITIDSSLIDATLTDFPLLIHLSVASGIGNDDVTDIINELRDDGGRAKIAITIGDGVTECEVEIENWSLDSLLRPSYEAFLWVKVPSVSSSSDTDLYIYWDAASGDNWNFIHLPDTAGAERVWDINFVGVYHMMDQSGLANDGDELPAGANNAFWQGVASDKDFFYALSSQWTGTPKDQPTEPIPPGNANARNIIRKIRRADGVQVQNLGDADTDAINSVDADIGDPCENCVPADSWTFSSGGISQANNDREPYLYVACRERTAATKGVSIIKYQLDPLLELEEIVLAAKGGNGAFDTGSPLFGYGLAEGVTWRNGFFWVVFGGNGGAGSATHKIRFGAIGQYDENWNEIAVHELFENPVGDFGPQDIEWLGDYDIIINNHEGHADPFYRYYRWTGSTFELRRSYVQLTESTTARIGQGFTVRDGLIYFASRVDDLLVRADLENIDTSLISDSTLNENHGTKNAFKPDGVGVAGMVFQAQQYDDDGVKDPTIDLFSPASLQPSSLSIDIAFRYNGTVDTTRTLVYMMDGFNLAVLAGGHIRVETTGLGGGGVHFSSFADIGADTIHVIGVAFSEADDEIKLFLDGVEVVAGDFPVTDATGSITYNGSDEVSIGSEHVGGAGAGPFWDGEIDEVRISNISRPDAYFKAHYNSYNDSLVTYGAAEVIRILPSGAIFTSGAGVATGPGRAVGY